MKKGYTLLKTEAYTTWGLKKYQIWKENRQVASQEQITDIFQCTDPAVLSHWLSCFAAETQTKDESQYPPQSIYSLLTGIQKHMKNTNLEALTFLNKANNHFRDLHNCLDVIFRRLCESNIGTSTVHHNPFTKEEIDQLWATGVLGTSNPQSLLNAVFFNNGMQFCLRGRGEHRRLKLDQIKREETGYIYYENGSKKKGTFSDRSVSNKVVKSERVPEAGERCHVALLDLYLSKLPADAHQVDAFYFRPLQKLPTEGPWYSAVPIGRNTGHHDQ